MSQASLDAAKRLYERILGRDPSPGDQANLGAYLDSGGNGAAAAANSAEAATHITTATIGANGLWTVSATAPLAPGTYTLTPVATLVGGKTIAGDAVTVTISGQAS